MCPIPQVHISTPNWPNTNQAEPKPKLAKKTELTGQVLQLMWDELIEMWDEFYLFWGMQHLIYVDYGIRLLSL